MRKFKEFLVTYKDNKGNVARAVIHGESAEDVREDFRAMFGTFELLRVEEQ